MLLSITDHSQVLIRTDVKPVNNIAVLKGAGVIYF